MKSMQDKRTLKYGGFSIAITILVIVAVLALNVLITYVENNKGLKVDFTPNASYTLDKNAETAIRDLENDVVIYTFIPAGENSSYSYLTVNIVALFDGASDRITSKNVDPVVNPSKLAQFSTDTKKLSAYAVVVAEKDNESNFHAFNENEMVEFNSNTQKSYFVLQRWITSALIYMRTGVRTNVYLLTGHGEDINENVETMLSRIRRENYNVEEISLIGSGKKLQQGDILILLEPKSDMSKEEYDQIITFLDDNYGKMLFAASRLTNDGGEPLKYYHLLLDYFNLSLNDGVVAETNENHRSASSARHIELVPDQAHAVSAAVRSGNEPVWVNDASSFTYKYGSGTTMGASYRETYSTVLTSYASAILVPWAQADEYDASAFTKAVQGVCGAYERVNEGITGTVATRTTRILLMGSVSLATGDYLGNSNILRNGLNWLAGKDAVDSLVNIGIDLTSGYVQMTQTQMKVWFTVLVICVPALILAGGIVVWIRRKNL